MSQRQADVGTLCLGSIGGMSMSALLSRQERRRLLRVRVREGPPPNLRWMTLRCSENPERHSGSLLL